MNSQSHESPLEEGTKKAPDILEGSSRAAERVRHEVRHQAGEKAKHILEEQKYRAANELKKTAQAFHEASRTFREYDRGLTAKYTERLAEEVDRYSRFLDERDMVQLLQELKKLARENPVMFLVGSFAAGVFVSRFLKSSTAEESAYRV